MDNKILIEMNSVGGITKMDKILTLDLRMGSYKEFSNLLLYGIGHSFPLHQFQSVTLAELKKGPVPILY